MMPKSWKTSALPRPFLSLINLSLPPCMHDLLILFHLLWLAKVHFCTTHYRRSEDNLKEPVHSLCHVA